MVGGRRTALAVVLAGLAVAILPTTASADSDGSFCVGRGYLAYETRFAAGGHLVHIVRFAPGTGIVTTEPIPIEDFQVHVMTCAADSVALDGTQTGVSVGLANRRVVTGKPSVDTTPAPPASNLGHWAKERIVTLSGDGNTPVEFLLVIARVSRRVAAGIEHYTTTHVIQYGRGAEMQKHVMASVKVFEGMFLETVD